jgi:integrase/recombinase XerD
MAAGEGCMFDPASVRFRGALAAHVSGVWSALLGEGYSPLTAGNHLRLAADFSRWLEGQRLEIGDLTDNDIDVFLRSRRHRGYTSYRTRLGLRPLLDYLHSCGTQIRPKPVVRTALDELLITYGEYLTRDRRLCQLTIARYVTTAREFATDCFGTRDPRWDQLNAMKVIGFVMREARRRSTAYIKHKLSNLRSFLRFLHVQGQIPVGLVGSVPAVAGWRLASVPPVLEPAQIERLLGLFKDRSPKARRNAAIVRLLFGLALRASDVAALELEDVDWRTGEITVCGKGKHVSRLPLPDHIGRALAAYLRCRPAVLTRRVFLRSRAPYHALTAAAVVSIARKALRAAGVTVGGAHLLRHTAATHMLRKGASLSEIAQVLRHRHLDTTAIYAKVALASLESLARPWPEALQ